MKTTYNVTEVENQKVHKFNTIKKAKEFIENWGITNNQHTGKVDIDKRTILWHVGTFKNPVIQFEKINHFN
jgi:hypothetical protein